jgi:hypothetical protein
VPTIGVILLDADVYRPVGDVGNPDTFIFPVRYVTATGAHAPHVVERSATGLLDTFVTAGRTLVDDGARALSTSCGFLCLYQQNMADALGVTVATSALLQVPLVLRTLPSDARLGVITANAGSLSAAHLTAAGISTDDQQRLTLIGLENTPHFYPAIVNGQGRLAPTTAEAEVVSAATTALDHDPAIRALLLECANLPPYAPAIRAATGLPVWDITTLLTWIEHSMHD